MPITFNPFTSNFDFTGAGSTGIVQTVVAGTGISVDNTDPANPIINATGSGSGLTLQQVQTVVTLRR